MKSIGILKTVYKQSGLVDRIVSNINDYASPQLRTFIQDDCSPDETFEKYVAAAPAFARIWQTASNCGARANVASLLEKCDTDYLTFAAGDDFIYPPTARALLELIHEDDPDIVIVKCVRVSEAQAYPLTRELNINAHFPPEACKNAQLFSIKWNSSVDIMVAAATNPGLIWSQGLLVRTSLAKRAGFLPSGEVDDWGFQHNLAVIALSEKVRVTLVDRILGVMSIQPNSMGSEVMEQLERQVSVIHRHWDPRFRKVALLNCLKKKLEQFRGDAFSYDDVLGGLASTLNRTP
jgi:hypothetical protein